MKLFQRLRYALFGPPPPPPPPAPSPGEPGHLEWVVRYHPAPVVRLCAAKALAAAAEERRQEERLRRIIREELDRA